MAAGDTKISAERRRFLRVSSGALVGGWALGSGAVHLAAQTADEAIAEAAQKVGRLPRRALGRSGREVTVLAGASDWAPEVIEAGLRCGVNYWHKAQRFQNDGALSDGRQRRTPAALLKEREAHYCEVVIDRVGGGHESGAFDEEAHYQTVKQAVTTSGLRYFDDMVLHFGFHNVAEYRANRVFVRAFERLKKEGLVRHLALTQHNYNGNAKVPGGESAVEILSAVMKDGLYEHAQIFYSFGDGPEVDAFLKAARAKGFGTIAMKTTRGIGRMQADSALLKALPVATSPYHALARWLSTETDLSTAVISLRALDQFVDTCSGAGRSLRARDRELLEGVRRFADAQACRLCNACLPACPERLPIADVLRYERYALDCGDVDDARAQYAELGRPGARCNACGECVSHCPQGLAIPLKLAAAHRLLA
jgi:predicted aldo/keto reductase-like oxidoreductase